MSQIIITNECGKQFEYAGIERRVCRHCQESYIIGKEVIPDGDFVEDAPDRIKSLFGCGSRECDIAILGPESRDLKPLYDEMKVSRMTKEEYDIREAEREKKRNESEV